MREKKGGGKWNLNILPTHGLQENFRHIVEKIRFSSFIFNSSFEDFHSVNFFVRWIHLVYLREINVLLWVFLADWCFVDIFSLTRNKSASRALSKNSS